MFKVFKLESVQIQGARFLGGQTRVVTGLINGRDFAAIKLEDGSWMCLERLRMDAEDQKKFDFLCETGWKMFHN